MRKRTSIVPYSRTTDMLSKHSRHSYEVFKELQIEEADLSKTLINNCYLYKCNVFSCKMDDCDLQGNEFENCIFYNTSFVGADISSCRFRNCTFERCEFDSTNILDCEFIHSTLYDCNFYVATVTNNIFNGCIFEFFAPKDTSMCANQFVKCKFTDSKLLTAIYYSLFCNCRFENTCIDSYILGFQFGMKRSQLKKCSLEHFGEQNFQYDDAIKKMCDVYFERKMLLEKEMLSFIKSGDLEIKLERLVCLVFEMIDTGYIIKVDEVRFLRQIINFIWKNNMISPYWFSCIIDTLRQFDMRDYKSRLSDNVFNEITILFHTLYSIRMELMEEYKDFVNILKENREILPKIQLEIVYRKCPQLRLSTLLLEACNKEIQPAYEKKGSFIEVFNLFWENINEIAAFITLLGFGAGLIRGLIALIKENRKRKKSATCREQEDTFEYETVTTIVTEEFETEAVSTQIDNYRNGMDLSVIGGNLSDERQQEATMTNVTKTISKHKVTIVKEYSNNIKKISIK